MCVLYFSACCSCDAYLKEFLIQKPIKGNFVREICKLFWAYCFVFLSVVKLLQKRKSAITCSCNLSSNHVNKLSKLLVFYYCTQPERFTKHYHRSKILNHFEIRFRYYFQYRMQKISLLSLSL